MTNIDLEKFWIVHISDIHETSEAAFTQMRDNFTDDVLKKLKVKPDVLVVSGDLVQEGADSEAVNGSDGEYGRTTEFINSLCEMFWPDLTKTKRKKRCIIIPGNHDVNWTKSSSGSSCVEKFDNFGQVFKMLTGRQWDKRQFWIWDFHDSDESKNIPPLYFVGLNSAYQVTEENTEAGLDPKVISTLRKYFDKKNLFDESCRIVVFHHGYFGGLGPGPKINIPIHLDADLFGKGKPFRIKKDYINYGDISGLDNFGFNLAMHGHFHFHSTFVSFKSGRSVPIVGAGSLISKPKDRRRMIGHQYNIIKLNLSEMKGDVYPRSRADLNLPWTRDERFLQAKEDYYTVNLNRSERGCKPYRTETAKDIKRKKHMTYVLKENRIPLQHPIVDGFNKCCHGHTDYCAVTTLAFSLAIELIRAGLTHGKTWDLLIATTKLENTVKSYIATRKEDRRKDNCTMGDVIHAGEKVSEALGEIQRERNKPATKYPKHGDEIFFNRTKFTESPIKEAEIKSFVEGLKQFIRTPREDRLHLFYPYLMNVNKALRTVIDKAIANNYKGLLKIIKENNHGALEEQTAVLDCILEDLPHNNGQVPRVFGNNEEHAGQG